MEPTTSRTLAVQRDQHGSLHVEVVPGTGVPIGLMHGFPDNIHLYDRLLPHLAGRRPRVRFDFLKTTSQLAGASTDPMHPYHYNIPVSGGRRRFTRLLAPSSRTCSGPPLVMLRELAASMQANRKVISSS